MAGWYASLLDYLPSVSLPKRNVIFKERMIWTLLSLVIYFALSDIPLLGMSAESLAQFEQLSAILGASIGTLITLGIGPIVSASIILQLLVGAKIIQIDLNTYEGRALYQGSQKLLAILFALLESTAFVASGAIRPVYDSFSIKLFLITQLFVGALIVIYLDELISRWGFGSGVSLFILAGVSKRLFIRAFNLMKQGDVFTGKIPGLIQVLITGTADIKAIFSIYLVPILATLFVFFIVVYAQSMRVEIPLVMSNFRGFGRKWPLKFIYTSNMPVILTAALLINLRVWARLLSNKGIYILGRYDLSGNVVSGLVYYLTPPPSFLTNLFHLNLSLIDIIRATSFMLFMIIGSTIFSIFWVVTAGMDAKSVAQQILNTGMQIPGFRRDPRIIERVLDRYIPALTVLGGAFVGFLAGFADLMNALTSGTGLLLAVMIAYDMYEQILRQNLEELHPFLRRMLRK